MVLVSDNKTGLSACGRTRPGSHDSIGHLRTADVLLSGTVTRRRELGAPPRHLLNTKEGLTLYLFLPEHFHVWSLILSYFPLHNANCNSA